MSFHFCSHPWEVRAADDGTIVKLTSRDLDREAIPVVVDDLLQVVMESGRPNLYLDFSEIHSLPSVAVGKLLSLDAGLREHGGQLTLLHVDEHVYAICQAASLTEMLAIRTDAIVNAGV